MRGAASEKPIETTEPTETSEKKVETLNEVNDRAPSEPVDVDMISHTSASSTAMEEIEDILTKSQINDDSMGIITVDAVMKDLPSNATVINVDSAKDEPPSFFIDSDTEDQASTTVEPPTQRADDFNDVDLQYPPSSPTNSGFGSSKDQTTITQEIGTGESIASATPSQFYSIKGKRSRSQSVSVEEMDVDNERLSNPDAGFEIEPTVSALIEGSNDDNV
jgi:hypothetical protein